MFGLIPKVSILDQFKKIPFSYLRFMTTKSVILIEEKKPQNSS